jgi:hypothetical protein
MAGTFVLLLFAAGAPTPGLGHRSVKRVASAVGEVPSPSSSPTKYLAEQPA